MRSNVIAIPFEEMAEADIHDSDPIPQFMEEVTNFCEEHGVDTDTSEFRHKAAVIMTQLQVILRGL